MLSSDSLIGLCIGQDNTELLIYDIGKINAYGILEMRLSRNKRCVYRHWFALWSV